MIEQWILNKIEPLKRDPLIVLRDPQRMVQAGARVVDGWAEDHGYTVLFCAGNLALREMYEAVRDEAEARVLVVDRSREGAQIPLFYPDLEARAGPRRQMTLSLRDFLIETSGDPHWPHLVNDRNLSRLILADLPDALDAYRHLRRVSDSRFSDTDLYKIVLGATLKINPFRQLSISEVRRLCIEQHRALDELNRLLPADVMAALRGTIASAPKPFCWLLDRDPDLVIRAFTLSAIMRQHGLEHQVLLSNLDPALHDLREIDPDFLDQALQDQLAADADRVLADVEEAEAFLLEDPERLAFLLHDRLQLDEPGRALAVLEQERLSPLIRGVALVSLLVDLIEQRQLDWHHQVLNLLDSQAEDPTGSVLALRRPGEQWIELEKAYRRAIEVYELSARLLKYLKKYKVTPAEKLDFAEFDRLWNEERLNRLDYYTSDLDRRLRVGNILPAPLKSLWPGLAGRWEGARAEFSRTVRAIEQVQNLLDTRFQELYRLHYAAWIKQPAAPVIFTHQFLPRLLKAHWDPQSGQKAVIMVFDGLRTDAWDELVRPVFEERFQIVASQPGSALIPTETQLSRKAISAGCLPGEFSSTNELQLLRTWLKRHLGLALKFEVVVDDDSLASGMTVRYVSDRLEYIIFNFTDKNLHHNPQDLAFIYNVTVREIIRQDVRSVLRELPDEVLIFITSDHGFTPVPEPTVTIPNKLVVNPHDVKYRNARTLALPGGEEAKKTIDFDLRGLGIPTDSLGQRGATVHHLLFPRPGLTFRRPRGPHRPDKYTHGGLSLAECLVPMVVMGPRQIAQPALSLERVRQVGSVSEGEELTLEITVAPGQIGLPDLAITLTFSRDEIPTRREVFSGARTTYTVRWTPHLEDISDEDRGQGVVVQPVTVILTYRRDQETVRLSQSTDVRIKLDPSRLRRRVDSRLDLIMGKVPKGLKS